MLYYLCNLKPPFRAKSIIELGQKIVREQPSPVHETYSDSLKKLITDLLQKDNEKRPELERIEVLNNLKVSTRQVQLLFPSEAQTINKSSAADNLAKPVDSNMARGMIVQERELSPGIYTQELLSEAEDNKFKDQGKPLHVRNPSGPLDNRYRFLESDMNEEYCNQEEVQYASNGENQYQAEQVLPMKKQASDVRLEAEHPRGHYLPEQARPTPVGPLSAKKEDELGTSISKKHTIYKIKSISKHSFVNPESVLIARERLAKELKMGVASDNSFQDVMLTKKQMDLVNLSRSRNTLFKEKQDKVRESLSNLRFEVTKKEKNLVQLGKDFEKRGLVNQKATVAQQKPSSPPNADKEQRPRDLRVKTASESDRYNQEQLTRPVSSFFKNQMTNKKEEIKNRLFNSLWVTPAEEKAAAAAEQEPGNDTKISQKKNTELAAYSVDSAHPRSRVQTAKVYRRITSGKLSPVLLDKAANKVSQKIISDSKGYLTQHFNSAAVARRPESSVAKKLTIHDL